MSKIGIFFYIKGKLFAYPRPIESGVDREGKIDSVDSHYDEYEKLSYHFEHDFEYFPRGRVVYDIEKKRSIVYIDRCIKDDASAKEEIISTFEIDPKKAVFRKDAHYKCHNCNPHYSDIIQDDFG